MLVDDILESMDMLESHLESISYIKIESKESDVKKAKYRLDKGDIDILFLDVVMPEFDGFTLLGLLKKMPATIICSANNDYSYEAFEAEVIDYISKLAPVKRVEHALIKAIRYLDEQEEKRRSTETSFILTRVSDDKETWVDWRDIIYVSIKDHILTVCDTDSEEEAYHSSLSSFLEKVPPEKFVRIHRSFVVNISAIRTRKNKSLVLWNWQELPVGAMYLKALIEVIKRSKS